MLETLKIFSNSQFSHQEVPLGKPHRALVLFLKGSVLLKQETLMY